MVRRNGTGSNTGAGYPQSKYGVMIPHRPLHTPGPTPWLFESHTPAIRSQIYKHTVYFWYISGPDTRCSWPVTAIALCTGLWILFPQVNGHKATSGRWDYPLFFPS